MSQTNRRSLWKKKKIKPADPCRLPPCKDVLMQKIKRTNYITNFWKNAHHSDPVRFCPEGNGWRAKNQEKLECVWFQGEETPEKIYVDNDEVLNDLSSDDFDENESLEYNFSLDEDEEEFIQETVYINAYYFVQLCLLFAF